MAFIERARQIPAKLATKFRDLRRGYSDEGLHRERRIYRGQITPEDREKFKRDEIERLSFLLQSGGRFSPDGTLINPSLSRMETVLGEIKQLDLLPNEGIDEILRREARSRLILWHKLPPPLRIIEIHPLFLRRK